MEYQNLILFISFFLISSCIKKDIPEENIKFTTAPDNNNGNINVTSDTLNLTVTITSKIPEGGVKCSLEMTQVDNGLSILNTEKSSTKATIELKTYSFQVGKSYSIKITVTSNKTSTNSSTASLITQRIKRVYKNYLKTSYELSNYDQWFSSNDLFNSDGSKFLHNPFHDGGSCQLDIDGDGLEDLFFYEEYDLNINPTPNPPPDVFINNGITLNRVPWTGPSIKYPHARLLVGDFNNDSLPDIFGLVAMDPPNGSGFPLLNNNCHLLFNSPTGFNKVKEFDDKLGFWYSGCSGDIDNDGDLDIIMFNFHYLANGVESVILWNDGKGNFTYDSNGIGKFPQVEESELIDINNDGFLDLVMDYIPINPTRQPYVVVMWGNGKGFDLNNATTFTYDGTKFMMDLDFADIDNDGIKEIFVSGIIQPPDYYIDIFKSDDQGKSFVDKTSTYFDNNHCTRFGHMIVKDIDKNGKLDIYSSDKNDNIRWEWNGTKFIKK